MTIRLLTPSDAAQLEAFLVRHRDSSMFLRSNARRAGLVFHGQTLQADYVAAFRDGAIGFQPQHARDLLGNRCYVVAAGNL